MSLETIWCDLKTCELNYDCGYGNGHCLDPTNADKCPYYKMLRTYNDTISRQEAINAFMTSTSDGDKAEWCKWVLEQLPPVHPSPCEFCKHNDTADTMACLMCSAERRSVRDE